MKRLLLLLLIPLLVGGWGPITHLQIAHMQGYVDKWADEAYQWGSLLPDFSLAYRAMGHSDYPNLQNVTHSAEFVEALRTNVPENERKAQALNDFVAGWEAHLYADTIESPYSKERVSQGAPCGADWVVDQAYAEAMQRECPWCAQIYCDWIDHALDVVGCETDCPGYWPLDCAYSGYIGGYQPNKAYYQLVLREWYSDYQQYVDRSAYGEPEPEPEPTPKPIRRARPWYDYEAPANRAEMEALKSAEWERIRGLMSETDDIAEKLRLFAEWESFRDAHATPSIRK